MQCCDCSLASFDIMFHWCLPAPILLSYKIQEACGRVPSTFPWYIEHLCFPLSSCPWHHYLALALWQWTLSQRWTGDVFDGLELIFTYSALKLSPYLTTSPMQNIKFYSSFMSFTIFFYYLYSQSFARIFKDQTPWVQFLALPFSSYINFESCLFTLW
jgi:hypothetical protein